jgi:hypothetical protein
LSKIMDTTLVTVTLLSMAMAASLSVIVWRMLRDERQRTEARVVALTMAARPAGSGPGTSAPETLETRPPTRDLALRDAPVHSAALFTEPERSSPWGRRLAVMGGVGLVFASVILVSLAASGKSVTRSTAVAGTAATASGAGVSSAAAAGLELLSLRDSRQPATLTITGLVQNPRGGIALSHVTVTAYAFDDKGSFLASGRAPIDVAALTPGDESPFVVTVPVTDTVARYRIGFRGEDGRVIAHIDKRQQSPVAVLRPGSEQANWSSR